MATSLGKVGIRNRGRFDASATYAAGEFVYYMGSTFIALQNLPAGMVPQHDGINWNFLAEGASVEQVLQNFAPIEDGATVSRAYSAGSYLLHEDILYKTMTDIASGGAIIIGTNITPVTIGEEMHSLAKNFANEEDSAVATMNYSVGQYLVYNEQFYKVTTAISAGQALVPGTNIEATTVGTQLSALSDSLTSSDISSAFVPNTSNFSSVACKVYKSGDVVTLSFSADPVAQNTLQNKAIGNMTNYRSRATIFATAVLIKDKTNASSQVYPVPITISGNGDLFFSNIGGFGYIGAVTANSTLHGQITYMTE